MTSISSRATNFFNRSQPIHIPIAQQNLCVPYYGHKLQQVVVRILIPESGNFTEGVGVGSAHKAVSD